MVISIDVPSFAFFLFMNEEVLGFPGTQPYEF